MSLLAATKPQKKKTETRMAKCLPSRSSVLTKAADWYREFGDQLDAGDYDDLGEDWPEDRELDQAVAWVRKYWSEVSA